MSYKGLPDETLRAVVDTIMSSNRWSDIDKRKWFEVMRKTQMPIVLMTDADTAGEAARDTPEKDARKTIDHLLGGRLLPRTIEDVAKAARRATSDSAIGTGISGNRRTE